MKKLKENIILRGIPASPGQAQGRTKIIKNKKDIGKLKYGDILISSFLDPDYLVYLKKNQKIIGIITNEGGRTCHAAIIARELKIPYIAGTQFATRKLKNNMRINMDAGNGIIYEVS